MHELAERESKSMSDEIARLNEEIVVMRNDLVEQKEDFRKKNVENDFKLKYKFPASIISFKVKC